MDLTEYQVWLKLAHVLGAFMFATGHGVSIFVAFRLRRETEAARMAALLDVSIGSFAFSFAGIGILVLAGAVGAVAFGYWGQGWLSVSILLLVVAFGLMTPLIAIPMGNLRRALGLQTRETKPGAPRPEPRPQAEVVAMAQALKARETLAVGGTIFLVIVALMVLKPF